MYHYKTSKRAVDILYEYNKFTKDYNTFLTSLKDDSSASLDFKRNKYLLDQLAEDLNRSFNRVKADVFNKKITNGKLVHYISILFSFTLLTFMSHFYDQNYMKGDLGFSIFEPDDEAVTAAAIAAALFAALSRASFALRFAFF